MLPVDASPLQVGTALPLGATWRAGTVTSTFAQRAPVVAGVNFAVRAPAATALWLTVYDARAMVVGCWPFPGRDGEVFHAFLPAPQGRPGLEYTVATASEGPALVEPYARRVVDAEGAPRAKVVVPPPTLATDRRPATPWSETVIHELHVKGYTQLHPAVPIAWRGKYLGLTVPAVLEHLQRLGVTAVELLPVQCFRTEEFLRAKGLVNYWGYNPLAWFAPAEQYAVEDPVVEFRDMVRALHAAGIEVILDVVFNHTCEGGAGGPVLSWRGLDDAATYRHLPHEPGRYDDLSGCGNTVDLSNAATRQLVLDCLHWWSDVMGVDGFRFDLAPILGRGNHGFSVDHPFFVALRADPSLAFVKWIAEPWDLGPGGYQLGHFPLGWAEWNDRYRDILRGFWRGDVQHDPALLGQFAERIAGSADLFRHAGRQPWASVNFIAAHDGYTLRDLVSYETRHNLANLEGNHDGHAHNLSWHCGVEGLTEEVTVLARRSRQQRNFLMSLFLSLGTPMLLGGDEGGRTQQGNNNAYCQDNALSWVNWEQQDPALVAFTATLARLRRERPWLRRDRYFKGAGRGGRDKDIAWLHPAGREMHSADWSSGLCVLGLLWSAMDGGRDLLWLINPTAQATDFQLPGRARDAPWELLLDSAGESAWPISTEPPFSLQAQHSLLLERSAHS